MPNTRRLAAALAAVALAALAACNSEKAFAPGVDPNAPVPGGYTADELAYFDETAFAFGFGGDPLAGDPGTRRVTKWDHDVRVAVRGPATAVDLANIDRICAEITGAIGGPVRVARDTTGTANVALVFEPRNVALAGLAEYFGFSPIGAVDPSFDASQHVDTATVHVAVELEGGVRYHVIRHELTHLVGLMAHTRRTDSVMNGSGNYIDITEYAAVDRAGIEMLYRDEVKAGMTLTEAKAALHALRRRRP